MIVRCPKHGVQVCVPVSQDLIEPTRSGSVGVIHAHEYCIGPPDDIWVNCFVSEEFATRHDLNIDRGWEQEASQLPEWFNELVFCCEVCFLDTYPEYVEKYPPQSGTSN